MLKRALSGTRTLEEDYWLILAPLDFQARSMNTPLSHAVTDFRVLRCVESGALSHPRPSMLICSSQFSTRVSQVRGWINLGPLFSSRDGKMELVCVRVWLKYTFHSMIGLKG